MQAWINSSSQITVTRYIFLTSNLTFPKIVSACTSIRGRIIIFKNRAPPTSNLHYGPSHPLQIHTSPQSARSGNDTQGSCIMSKEAVGSVQTIDSP